MSQLQNVWDYRDAAKRKMPRAFFEFLDRGSEDETALAANRTALEAVRLRQTILQDVRVVDTSTEIFGRRIPLPLATAPTGVADVMAFRGELAVAAAAGKAGIPYTLATSSTTPMEKVVDVATAGCWLQMYVWDEREASYEIADRAERAGVEALMITVDSPVLANREYNTRNGFVYPIKPRPRLVADILAHPRWFYGTLVKYWMNGGLPAYANYPAGIGGKVTGKVSRRAQSASITWDDIARFRDRWKGRLILKGILDPADAERAARIGADAISVSNHGGRMFDAAPSGLDALPAIAATAPREMAVLYDGGIRRGLDILRALAMGARAVMVGRATLYGVAVGGEQGAAHVIEILRSELERGMALAGKTSVASIGRECIWPGGDEGG
jgi:L-lactate dehydrogenase (cytochrome)/(S)-mandelate dehydrogenase